MSKDRYGHQGELETELREKIRLAFKYGVGEGHDSFASCVADLLVDTALSNNHLDFESKAEMVNSMAGQYFHNVFPCDTSKLPAHLSSEIALLRD